MKQSSKRILVAPLNWGLGHATRCIPIIRELIRLQQKVIIAADGAALKLLKHEFPVEEFIQLEDVTIRYPRKIPFTLFFALRFPAFQRQLKKEHKLMAAIVKKHQLDGIISDNRYGLYHPTIPAVIITHQLFIRASFFEKKLHKFTKQLLSKFIACWIPDFKGEKNLSGQLSHGVSLPQHVRFIGPQTRFGKSSKMLQKKRDLLVVLSGPEPQRSVLESKIRKQLLVSSYTSLIVRGIVEEEKKSTEVSSTLSEVNFLTSQELETEMQQSRLIVCRAAYSSVMDLAMLDCKALLIPTKGQSEQEYLSKHLRENQLYYTVDEKTLNLETDVSTALNFKQDNLPKTEQNFAFLEEFVESL